MSPWVNLESKAASFEGNDRTDTIPGPNIPYWAECILADVPITQKPYASPSCAPKDWFRNLDTVTNRLLVTAGDAERFRDDIVEFAKTLKANHNDVTFVLQKHGVHIDPYFDFLVWEKQLGYVTPFIVEWLAEGFKPSSS